MPSSASTGETQTFSVTVNGDTTIEANETFTATIGAVTALTATQTSSVTTRATATSTLFPTRRSSDLISSPTITETNSGTTTLTFTVTSPSAVQGGFTVGYSTS